MSSEDRSGAVTELVADEVRALAPADELEARHRDEVLRWLATTTDVFRRVSQPVTPVRHLVSYFLVVDTTAGKVLLGDHIKAGKWLPSGGHVEPGEHPTATVVRECAEELGVDAAFHPAVGPHPLFVTITDTVGSADIHNDVSLWYLLELTQDTALTVDDREYRSVHWWSPDEINDGDPRQFDPHMGRMLHKISALWGFGDLGRHVSSQQDRPTLVVFAGLPGSGKTTVARGVADALAATFLRIDTIETAVAVTLPGSENEKSPVGYIAAEWVAEDQLTAGRAVVIDACNEAEIARAGWRDLAARVGADLRWVEVSCSDKIEHQRRIVERRPDRPGQAAPTWQEVEARDRSWEQFEETCIRIDNLGPVASHVAQVVHEIRR